MNSIYARVIKYKAWHRKKKQLYGVAQITFHDHGRFTITVAGEDATFTDADVELLQYTNLPDRHDQEIYEGHIVHDPETDQYYEVLYRADRYMVERRVISATNPGYELSDLYDIYDKVEIAGTIFEHRDLLKKVGYTGLSTDDILNPDEIEDVIMGEAPPPADWLEPKRKN